jgi:DNA primase
VNAEKKVYYCFGCQESGDAIKFVEATEGLDFREAVEALAERYNVELKRDEEDPEAEERRKRRQRLMELVERATAYYERVLWESAEAGKAREYLAGRGLGDEVLRGFRVGYAPSAWDSVMMAAQRLGFSQEELAASGLGQWGRNGGFYDRFRGRIMFPLADVRGRVLGFGARAMRDEQRPKYLNTSDNEIYHKGRHLYGADLARVHATRAGQVILCEGYTDVIALHQAGLRNTVGLMGTALTDEQVGELARMASTVLLALDADSAGQEAMLRASRLAASRKLELRVVALPAGADPADLVQREGVEAINAAVAESVQFVRFRVERALAAGDHSSPEGRDRMISELRPVFATLPPSAVRMDLTRMVSGRLQLPENLTETLLAHEAEAAPVGAREALGRADTTAPGGRDPSPNALHRDTPGESPQRRAAGILSRREETERTFLALCIASPEAGKQALQSLELSEHFTSELLRRAAAHLRAGDLCEPLKGSQDGGLEEDPELMSVLAELVVEAGGESKQTEMLDVQRLQLELARVDRQIQAARVHGSGEVSELAHRRGEVKRAFDHAYERALEQTGL